jgi:hypothetical protein
MLEGSSGMTVAVDDEPRVAGEDSRCTELVGKGAGQRGGTDVPRDMPRESGRREPKLAERRRDRTARVVADEKRRGWRRRFATARTAAGHPRLRAA